MNEMRPAGWAEVEEEGGEVGGRGVVCSGGVTGEVAELGRGVEDSGEGNGGDG